MLPIKWDLKVSLHPGYSRWLFWYIVQKKSCLRCISKRSVPAAYICKRRSRRTTTTSRDGYIRASNGRLFDLCRHLLQRKVSVLHSLPSFHFCASYYSFMHSENDFSSSKYSYIYFKFS